MNDVKVSKRTKFTYAGTGIGRDMMYALYSNFLLIFFIEAIGVQDWELRMIGYVIAAARVWDAINDPMMGVIIDNTRTRFGKFKPWILTGAISSAIIFFLLFQNFSLTGMAFVLVYGSLYFLSGMAFTMNDISYWSMYPSLTTNPKERESIGSLARIFASVGMFIIIALVPIIYQNASMGRAKAFGLIALVVCLIYLASQVILVLFVKQPRNLIAEANHKKTTLKDMFKIIAKNDQLLVIIVSILLFNTGYFITAQLGLIFFNYDFNKYGGGEFLIFSVILAVSQLTALSLFPMLAKKFTRKRIFGISIIMIVIGYALFMSVNYVLPMNMLVIGLAGLVLFSGQGFIQVLVLVMLADTIEYGQWKLGTRNESVVFAINPFVTKMATAIQTLVLTQTLTRSGLNREVINPTTQFVEDNPEADNQAIRDFIADRVTPEMLLSLRVSMIVIPLILIVLSYVIYRLKYKIDDELYAKITKELNERALKELEV
ncbi:MAG: glycoside-pentoside-hexuronide (GPH):cation symporter [Acholeplasmataceae bacterium]|jgi:melibiose permease/lactose/raffinose/galactose permease|nr:glycoside-pentoside-hexuronide (GPH):cation symporter [Acholeplasmataceae bacterium]